MSLPPLHVPVAVGAERVAHRIAVTSSASAGICFEVRLPRASTTTSSTTT